MSKEEFLSEEEVQLLGKALIDAVNLDHLNQKQRELFTVMMQGYSAMGQKLDLEMKEGLEVMQAIAKGIQAQCDQMDYYLKNRA